MLAKTANLKHYLTYFLKDLTEICINGIVTMHCRDMCIFPYTRMKCYIASFPFADINIPLLSQTNSEIATSKNSFNYQK